MTPYYQDSAVTIFHGDCREIVPSLERFDLVLTDPPYGTTGCRWDHQIDLDDFWRMTNGSTVVATSSQPFTSRLVMSNIKNFKHEWIWEKNRASNFLSARFQPLKTHESVVVFCPEKLKYNPQISDGHAPVNLARRKANSSPVYGTHKESVNNAGATTRYPTSILKFKCLDNCSKERYHPTQKPVDLFKYLVATYSEPGDVILDFYAGSGTTGRAAKDLGRRAILVEIEEKSCEVAAMRMQQDVLNL